MKDPVWIPVLLFFWAIALSYALFPTQVSRFSLKYQTRMIGRRSSAARLMAPRQFRRAGIFMLIVMAVITCITYLALTSLSSN